MLNFFCSFCVLFLAWTSCLSSVKNDEEMKYNPLTPQEERVIMHKGTEMPFTGELLNNKTEGTYLCKRCDSPLYRSKDKFESGCGWPSFDDELPGAVKRIPDADGRRTEIVCEHCGGHLGHVFLGEEFTAKNTRHCVNSISMKFVPQQADTAYFASGCFWGTEFYMMKAPFVLETSVGFMGGQVENPTYEQVCTKTTGHVETTRVVFDANMTSYENLVRLFFETHDFTQTDGQGPDIGPQYRSFIFYTSQEQEATVKKYIDILTGKGYRVATRLQEASRFWPAEAYHQQYYEHKGSRPYCHKYTPVF